MAYCARNFLWDARGDYFWRRGAFPLCDFGLPRIGLSSAVYPSNLDSLCSSSNISSSSAWAMGPIWNGPGSPDPLAPQYPFKILLSCSSGREEDFDALGPTSWPVESCSPVVARASSPAQGMLLVFWCTRCAVINTLIDDSDCFDIQSVHSMAPLWSGVDLAVEDSLGNWAQFISTVIPS